MAISIRAPECDELVERIKTILGPGRTTTAIVTLALQELEIKLVEQVPLQDVVRDLRKKLRAGV